MSEITGPIAHSCQSSTPTGRVPLPSKSRFGVDQSPCTSCCGASASRGTRGAIHSAARPTTARSDGSLVAASQSPASERSSTTRDLRNVGFEHGEAGRHASEHRVDVAQRARGRDERVDAVVVGPHAADVRGRSIGAARVGDEVVPVEGPHDPWRLDRETRARARRPECGEQAALPAEQVGPFLVDAGEPQVVAHSPRRAVQPEVLG